MESEISRSGEKKRGKYDNELEWLTVERGFHTERRAAVTETGHQAMDIDEEET
jgi:hypothetical protein